MAPLSCTIVSGMELIVCESWDRSGEMFLGLGCNGRSGVTGNFQSDLEGSNR